MGASRLKTNFRASRMFDRGVRYGSITDLGATSHVGPLSAKVGHHSERLGLCLASRDGNLPKRRLQALRQLERIVVGPKMNEEEKRLLVEHMAVDGRHLDERAMTYDLE